MTAKAYVTAPSPPRTSFDIGKGRGPVHHFHEWCRASGEPSATTFSRCSPRPETVEAQLIARF